MSPQGQQAQALFTKAQGYDPKRDTRSQSLLKHYKKQAAHFTQSGTLPENERSFFSKQFSGVFS